MGRRTGLIVCSLLLWGGVCSWGRGDTLWTGRGGRLAGIDANGIVSWFLFPEGQAENLAAGQEKDALPGGICLGVRVGEEIRWLHDWNGTTSYTGPGHRAVVSERKQEELSLAVTVRSCFDEGGVLLQSVSLRNEGDGPLKKVHVLAHARFREEGEEARVSLGEGMALFPLRGGGCLAAAGDGDQVVILSGSKEGGAAAEGLLLWLQGEQTASLEDSQGAGLHFCMGWDVSNLKKGEENELAIRWACGASREDASKALTASLEKAPKAILSLNQPSEGMPSGEEAARGLALLQSLCQDSGAILSPYPQSWV